MNRRFWAFTLAETLIVMGIIGVVAALTVPNLNASTGEKEKVAKVKKIYRDLNDAIGRSTAVYGPVNEWFINDNTYVLQATRFGERVSEFMKVSKNCGTATGKGCFGSTYDSLTPSYKLITADGTSIQFFYDAYWLIFIDIDGPSKGKNLLGSDIFILEISQLFYKNADIDPITAESKDLSKDANITNYCFKSPHTYCIPWILQNDNMDYLKVDSSGKCPNGTVLSWTNTTCK